MPDTPQAILDRAAVLLAGTPGTFVPPPCKFAPKQRIKLRAYDGKPRDETGEVYKIVWSPDAGDWCVHVVCDVPAGAKAKFRNFFEGKLEVEE